MGLKYPNGSGNIGFMRKRDKVQFLGGSAIAAIGCGIIITTSFECRLGFGIGCAVVLAGALMALTSRLCMKV